MWYPSDEQMFSDEVVADGVQHKQRIPFPSSSPSYKSSSSEADKNADSGFLSGASIVCEDDEMKIKSRSAIDSGLDLAYAGVRPGRNDLTTVKPKAVETKAVPPRRTITLLDLLRQDQDGDT